MSLDKSTDQVTLAVCLPQYACLQSCERWSATAKDRPEVYQSGMPQLSRYGQKSPVETRALLPLRSNHGTRPCGGIANLAPVDYAFKGKQRGRSPLLLEKPLPSGTLQGGEDVTDINLGSSELLLTHLLIFLILEGALLCAVTALPPVG